MCPVTQQGSWPWVLWTHKCSFESVQGFWIKEHVSCGSGPGYNQNSLLDCLDQQCSTYLNSSHHNPDLDFQVPQHGPQPFLNRTIANKWVCLMAEDSSGTDTAWHIAISMCHHHHCVYLKGQGDSRTITSTHIPKHTQPDTAPTWWCISEVQFNFSVCEG